MKSPMISTEMSGNFPKELKVSLALVTCVTVSFLLFIIFISPTDSHWCGWPLDSNSNKLRFYSRTSYSPARWLTCNTHPVVYFGRLWFPKYSEWKAFLSSVIVTRVSLTTARSISTLQQQSRPAAQSKDLVISHLLTIRKKDYLQPCVCVCAH